MGQQSILDVSLQGENSGGRSGMVGSAGGCPRGVRNEAALSVALPLALVRGQGLIGGGHLLFI
jgi:hypothetical protein